MNKIKKKINVTMLILLIILFIPRATLAKNSTRDWIGLGYDGERLSIGARAEWPTGTALEIGTMIHVSGYSNVNDYACPHWDYYVLDSRYPGFTFGVDLIRMFDLTRTIALYGGLGLYFCEYKVIVQSNVTGWLYEQSSSTETELTYSAGMRMQKDPSSHGIAFGYHSLRGINILFEFSFR